LISHNIELNLAVFAIALATPTCSYEFPIQFSFIVNPPLPLNYYWRFTIIGTIQLWNYLD